MLSLGACGQKVVEVGIPVPQELSKECTETAVSFDLYEQGVIESLVNGDLLRKIDALRSDLKACNADKQCIQLWSDKIASDGL